MSSRIRDGLVCPRPEGAGVLLCGWPLVRRCEANGRAFVRCRDPAIFLRLARNSVVQPGAARHLCDGASRATSPWMMLAPDDLEHADRGHVFSGFNARAYRLHVRSVGPLLRRFGDRTICGWALRPTTLPACLYSPGREGPAGLGGEKCMMTGLAVTGCVYPSC